MDDKDFFPFEKYIGSTCIQEYNKDVRRKNYIQKYINLIVIDNLDAVSLNKLVQNFIFFRNVFCSDCVIKFCNEFYSEEERTVIACVVYDMFVVSKKKSICEDKTFFDDSVKLLEYVDRKHIINTIWCDLKSKQDIV